MSRLDTSRPRLMAIVNATPDSFSDGGEFFTSDKLNRHLVATRLEQIVEEGADILDIGGESTRPGAKPITVAEELDRVMPVVELASEYEVGISVDTSSPEVMREAAAKGAHLINDVRALTKPGAIEAAAQSGLMVCLMHMQGSPATMQLKPEYDDPIVDVTDFLQQRVIACVRAGIDKEKLWLDPGFGFGKKLEHNLRLVKQLPDLVSLGFPVLVGMSRKSMFGHLLGREVHERLPASLAFATMALERGAKIIRAHDVKATRDVIDSFLAIHED